MAEWGPWAGMAQGQNREALRQRVLDLLRREAAGDQAAAAELDTIRGTPQPPLPFVMAPQAPPGGPSADQVLRDQMLAQSTSGPTGARTPAMGATPDAQARVAERLRQAGAQMPGVSGLPNPVAGVENLIQKIAEAMRARAGERANVAQSLGAPPGSTPPMFPGVPSAGATAPGLPTPAAAGPDIAALARQALGSTPPASAMPMPVSPTPGVGPMAAAGRPVPAVPPPAAMAPPPELSLGGGANLGMDLAGQVAAAQQRVGMPVGQPSLAPPTVPSAAMPAPTTAAGVPGVGGYQDFLNAALKGKGGEGPLGMGKDQYQNLLQFGLALMAAGDVQPGATKGPTFMGATGKAGLATLGDMMAREKTAYERAKDTATATVAERRHKEEIGLKREELGVKKEDVEATRDLKKATLEAKTAQDRVTNEIAALRARIDEMNLTERQKANATRAVTAYENAMGKLIERDDYDDAEPPVKKAMRNELRQRFGMPAEPTDPNRDPQAIAIGEARRAGKITKEQAAERLRALGYQ